MVLGLRSVAMLWPLLIAFCTGLAFSCGLAEHVSAACDDWSAQLRGLRLTLDGLLFVRERQIIALDGEWHTLPFGTPAS